MRQLDLHQLRLLTRTQILPQCQLIHHLLHLLSFAGFLSGYALFLGSGLRLGTALTDASNICRVQHKVVIVVLERDGMATGVDACLPYFLFHSATLAVLYMFSMIF